jgi:hypothetical protein
MYAAPVNLLHLRAWLAASATALCLTSCSASALSAIASDWLTAERKLGVSS